MSAKQFTARAGANIALIKYWGKRNARLNLPAAGSLSITLANLETTTTVVRNPALRSDELVLNGRSQDAGRVTGVLDLMRVRAGRDGFCRVESHNSFRSEERRVGKECRTCGRADQQKKRGTREGGGPEG